MVARVRRWLDARSSLQLFGGAALFLCVLQLATGLLLAIYYQPTPEAAHGSVARIMGEVPFGWLVRNLHTRGADLFVAVLIAHLLVSFFRGAYRAPREANWMTGCAMFAVVLGLCFSGSLLPWDSLAYSATQVGTEEARTVPVVGDALARFVRGGEQVGGPTLSRFYAGHIALFPGALLALLAVHLYLVRRHGLSRPEGARGALEVLAAWVGVFGVLVLMAVLLPRELGRAADPLAPPPPGIRPEWYFTPPFELLRIVPGSVAGVDGALAMNLFFVVLGLVWLTVPFWDRAPKGERSGLATALGALTVLFIAGITAYSYGRAR